MTDVEKILLNILFICGLDPRRQDLLAYTLQFLIFTSAFIGTFLNVLELFLNFSGVETIINLHSTPILVMVLVKVVNIMIHKHTLLRILNRISTFWPRHIFGKETELRLANVKRITTNFILFFVCCAFLSIFSFSVGTLLNEEKITIMSGYHVCNISTSPCFELLYTWHVTGGFLQFAPANAAMDGLFIYFVMECYCSLELLKVGFKQLIDMSKYDDAKNRRRIGRIVDEHNNILSFIKDLDEFYQGTLLIQCWSSLGCFIMCLYIISYTGVPPDYNILTKFGVLFILLCIQLALYSTGGSIIIEQTKSIAINAYSTDWYTKTSLRRDIAFIIFRSQNYEKLTIGKMADLDMNAFLNILQNAVSVFTLLRTIENSK